MCYASRRRRSVVVLSTDDDDDDDDDRSVVWLQTRGMIVVSLDCSTPRIDIQTHCTNGHGKLGSNVLRLYASSIREARARAHNRRGHNFFSFLITYVYVFYMATDDNDTVHA